MKVNGVSTAFIVVHHGLPSANYDSSCNGIWLLMKDIYTSNSFGSSNNDYAFSYVHTYLNDTFFNLFDNNIKNIIKQVIIPYSRRTADSPSYLSAKVFLLSCTEIGISNMTYLFTEGAVLSYFSDYDSSKLIAKKNGTDNPWWTRSPYTLGTDKTWLITQYGGVDDVSIWQTRGLRPSLILPSTQCIDENYNVLG